MSRLSLLFEVHAAARQVGVLVATAMTDSPLTPEDYAVYSVLFDEGPHTPTELARRIGMPATSMTHVVRTLLARGHVERATSPHDRRSYRIILTPAGGLAHAAAGRAFAEADRRFSRAFALDPEVARATLRELGEAASRAEQDLLADSRRSTG